jgi:hypothetical protein
MGNFCKSTRPKAALLAPGVVLGALLGMTACADGANRPTLPSSAPSFDRPSFAPSIGRPGDRPESPDGAESPAGIASAPTRETRTPEATTPPPEPTRTATTEAAAQPATPTRTTAATATAAETPTRADPTAAASPVSGTAVSDTSGGLGPFGWIVLFILAAAVIGGVLIRRSRRNADWAADADALTVDTRTVIGTQLPSVLGTVTAVQRALSWPPVRADVVDLLDRWALLPDNAPGEQRAAWSRQAWGQLREVLAAVDAENEALAAGQQWTPLRLRVDDAGRALFATLSGGHGAGADPSLA